MDKNGLKIVKGCWINTGPCKKALSKASSKTTWNKLRVYTVRPVYNNHSMDQVIVVSVEVLSLYRGALVQLKWTMNQPTVVSIDRWSLYASGL